MAFIEIGILALMVFVSIYKKVYNKKALMCLVTAAVLLVCETKICKYCTRKSFHTHSPNKSSASRNSFPSRTHPDYSHYYTTDDMYGTYCVLYRAEHWQKPLRGCCHYGALHNGTFDTHKRPFLLCPISVRS